MLSLNFLSKLHQIVSCIFMVLWHGLSLVLALEITFFGSLCKYHSVKSVRIRRYSVSLSIQSECWKMRTRITPNTDPFQAVYISFLQICNFIFNWNGWQHSPTLSNIAQRWCSYKKVSWKYIANLQDSTHA